MITIKLSAFADEAASSLEEQMKALQANNIHLLELRGINGKNINDFSDEEAKSYYSELNKNGIEVFSLGSPLGKKDIMVSKEEIICQTRRLCELAIIFHCKNIRMFSFYNAFEHKDKVFELVQEMVNIGKEYGINMCHENEKKIYGEDVSKVKEIFANVNGLKQVYDPANFIQCDVDATLSLDELASSAYYYHIKDALLSTHEVVSPGNGDGKVLELIQRIKEDKVLTIEPHLKVFKGFASTDKEELKNKEVYNSNLEAFNAAVKATKKLLILSGYVEQCNCFIKED